MCRCRCGCCCCRGRSCCGCDDGDDDDHDDDDDDDGDFVHICMQGRWLAAHQTRFCSHACRAILARCTSNHMLFTRMCRAPGPLRIKPHFVHKRMQGHWLAGHQTPMCSHAHAGPLARCASNPNVFTRACRAIGSLRIKPQCGHTRMQGRWLAVREEAYLPSTHMCALNIHTDTQGH